MNRLPVILAVANFTVVIVGLTAVLLIVWSMPVLPTIENNKVCLTVEHGRLNCSETSLHLHSYFKQKIKDAYSRRLQKEKERNEKYKQQISIRLAQIYHEYYWEMKPSAKLIDGSLPTDVQSQFEDMVTVRGWSLGNDLYNTDGFERYGARFRNDRIVVPVCGTYVIYSHLDLYENSSTPSPEKYPIRHAVYKFNILEEAEIKIAESVQPHKAPRPYYSYSCYSSYVETLVQLKAGDELSVKVSNMPYLNYPGDNYFGVNLVSDLCQFGAAFSSR